MTKIEKLLKFDEIVGVLRQFKNELMEWNKEHEESLSKDMLNDLHSIVNYLEGYQDYLIEKAEKH